MVDNEKNQLAQTKFTITNFGESYSFNANAASNDQLSDVLGTLIRDLAELGIINPSPAIT